MDLLYKCGPYMTPLLAEFFTNHFVLLCAGWGAQYDTWPYQKEKSIILSPKSVTRFHVKELLSLGREYFKRQ